MSIISDAIRSASVSAQSLLGDSFSISQLGTFIGVFNTLTREVSNEDVGYILQTRFTCVSTKAQYGSEPQENMRLIYNGSEYIIENVSEDDLNYTMSLVKTTA